MGRQRKVSDEAILQAAQRVLAARGMAGFTLTEVAQESGLSRAAISLRFASIDDLMLRLTERSHEYLSREIEALPVVRSGDGLIAFASMLGALTPDMSALATLMLSGQKAFEQDHLAAKALHIRDIVCDAMAARMPEHHMRPQEAAESLMTHLAGAVLARPCPDTSPADYLGAQTKLWLTLARIPFCEEQDHRSLVDDVRRRSPYAASKD